MELGAVVAIIQLLSGVIIAVYFFGMLRTQRAQKVTIERDSAKEMGKLARLRGRSLAMPLSEKTRPARFEDIIGQSEGITALKAALCCPNPQHVLIYGPPGIGKTCAARLVLEEAKRTHGSPFRADAKFIEMDATCIRFDERAIADPLIGSVHDPIYQGAGSMGAAGIPQPKPGAVTKAHCGILFLDEIGEIHPVQMNKLLKVLEDRKVNFESAYYSSEDPNIPRHIHDIFENGLPADFRLVGATTRSPQDIPPAIRSRCLEIFFRPLKADEIELIARGAANRGGFEITTAAAKLCGKYADNGRDAVNMVQLAGGLAYSQKRSRIESKDVEWVAQTCHYRPRLERSVPQEPQSGFANGLAVTGSGQGSLLEIEAVATKAKPAHGKLLITGMIDEEEMGTDNRKLRRKSTAISSVENVLSVLKRHFAIQTQDYDIHLNLPGGAPVDGPSAGLAVAVAIYSAITGKCANPKVALTGELSIRALVRPVGGVKAKVEAALSFGAERVVIPHENYMDSLERFGAKVVPVKTIFEAMDIAFDGRAERAQADYAPQAMLSACNAAATQTEVRG